MAIRSMKFSAWQKASATHLDKPSYARYTGSSPGDVAAKLGISRQAVHKAIHRGDLEALIVRSDATDDLMFFLIPSPSVQAFIAKREQRKSA